MMLTRYVCCSAPSYQDNIIHFFVRLQSVHLPHHSSQDRVPISLSSFMQNLQPVISHLLTLSNTTEQRDGRRDTPLMLAHKRGLEQVVDMLLTAGATDLPSSASKAGCRAWSPGIWMLLKCIGVYLPSKGCSGHHDCCRCAH